MYNRLLSIFKAKKPKIIGVTAEKSGVVADEKSIILFLEEADRNCVDIFNLDNCNLHYIPNGLERQHDSLRIILFKNNKLEKLSPTLFFLKNLVYIDFSNNHLRSLPKTFIKLGALGEINLDNNEFKELPTILVNLPKLRRSHLTGNPLQEKPKQVGSFLRWDLLDSLQWIKVGSYDNVTFSQCENTENIYAEIPEPAPLLMQEMQASYNNITAVTSTFPAYQPPQYDSPLPALT